MFCYLETSKKKENESEAEGQHQFVPGQGEPSGQFNYRGRVESNANPAGFQRVMARKGYEVIFTNDLVTHPEFEGPDPREYREIPREHLIPHAVAVNE